MFVAGRPPTQTVTFNILDFNPSEGDRIDLSSLCTTLDALLAWRDERSGDTMMRVSGTVTIRLVGFALAQLKPGDFIF